MNKLAIIALLFCAVVAVSALVTKPPANFNKNLKTFDLPKKNLKSINANPFESVLPRSVSENDLSARSWTGFQSAYCAYNPTEDPCPWKEIEPVPLVGSLPSNVQTALNQIKNMFNSYNVNPNQGGYHSCNYASITYNGAKIWEYDWGTVSRESTAKPTGNTIFRIASITKVFTALAVMRLYQDGKIKSLDDPISTYYPSFKIKTFTNDTKGPTIRSMLVHLSALPRESPCYPFDEESCFQSKASIVAKFANQYSYGPIYKNPSYSNSAFDLLGRLLESKMEMSWENYVQTKILNPLGMTNTYTTFSESFYPRMAVGYGANYGEDEVWYNDFGFQNPSINMYSTANDLNKLFIELNKAWAGLPTKFLNHDLIRQTMHPHFVMNDVQQMFGAPYEIFPHSGYLVVSKAGDTNGYATIMATVPEIQLTFNILFNSDGPFQSYYLNQALDKLLPAVISALNPVVPIPTVPTATQNKFVGRYVYYEDVSEATIAKQGNALTIHFTYNDFTYYMKPTSQSNVFILVPPKDTYVCEWYLYSGNNDLPMYVKYDNRGNVVSFELPAAYVDVTFTKY